MNAQDLVDTAKTLVAPVQDAVVRMPRLGAQEADLKQRVQDILIGHEQYPDKSAEGSSGIRSRK
jgi:hypothetical protein